MENQEKNEFSWSGLFIVTACCTFFFNVALKFLDGSSSLLLTAISGGTAVLGVISWGIKIVLSSSPRKKRDSNFAS